MSVQVQFRKIAIETIAWKTCSIVPPSVRVPAIYAVYATKVVQEFFEVLLPVHPWILHRSSVHIITIIEMIT